MQKVTENGLVVDETLDRVVHGDLPNSTYNYIYTNLYGSLAFAHNTTTLSKVGLQYYSKCQWHTANKVSVWSLSVDDDDELEDENNLLDESDLINLIRAL
ncbi:unnamed protein product [Rhizophagus irregularis]|nr:unnamed protein product [Rhizophagus irregularis]